MYAALIIVSLKFILVAALRLETSLRDGHNSKGTIPRKTNLKTQLFGVYMLK